MADFLDSIVLAFPSACESATRQAAQELLPLFDKDYGIRGPEPVIVCGETLQIPNRIHFMRLTADRLIFPMPLAGYANCICSRSTDGYIRQAALKNIIGINESWTIPFVIMLVGEYVIEIIEEIANSAPMLEKEIYIQFVKENRLLMRRIRAKAISYWDCYYRHAYPEYEAYPAIAFLNQLELWAG